MPMFYSFYYAQPNEEQRTHPVLLDLEHMYSQKLRLLRRNCFTGEIVHKCSSSRFTIAILCRSKLFGPKHKKNCSRSGLLFTPLSSSGVHHSGKSSARIDFLRAALTRFLKNKN
ncbi:unnamed protein product [Amoebophrya sp. A120]|nr:unnamed protein product [Amoebophrya sp. A120]|eukprot:GSA120T00007231001.1